MQKDAEAARVTHPKTQTVKLFDALRHGLHATPGCEPQAPECFPVRAQAVVDQSRRDFGKLG